MATYHLKNHDFLLLESNDKLGKKLAVCGGGFVNVTNKNLSPKNYLGDKEFINSIFDEFNNLDLTRFFKDNKIDIELRSDGCYFGKKRSSNLIDFFVRNIEKSKIGVNEKVLDLIKKDDLFEVKTNRNIYRSKKVLIATGSPSYPVLGSTDSAINFAKKFGHTTTQFSPVLAGFTLQPQDAWMKNLSGVSLPIKITVEQKEIEGNILFAHRGVTGPAILNASLWWKKGKITIDFLPQSDLDKLIRSNPNKTPISMFPLPKRFIKEFFLHLNIELKPLKNYSKKELDLIRSINSYQFAPAGNFGLTKAEACRGGVLTDEVNPKTLESRIVSGLFIVGEALDITGEVGGYNLQWAFSTGFLVAKSIKSNKT